MPALHVPLDRDEGGFAYIAQTWLQGHLPYRDAFDNKAPLLYAMYGAAIALFGSTSEALHLFFTLLALLQVGLMYSIAKRWMSKESALAAAFIFALLASEPTYAVGTAGNASNLVLLPLLLAVWWLPASAWLAGLFVGAAVMTKQTALLQGFAFGIYLLLTRENTWRETTKYLFGILLIPAAFTIYFFGRGAGTEFFHEVWAYNVQHSTGVAVGGHMLEGLGQLRDHLWALAPAEGLIWFLAFGGLLSVCRFKNRGTGLMLEWLIASLASVCVSFRFTSHYFVELAPAFALLSGYVLEFRGIPRHRWMSLMAVVVLSGVYLTINRDYLFGGAPEAFSRSAYEGNYFSEAVPVARRIAETTSASDRVLIFGSEPEILFLSQRASATRHIFFYPLTLERATLSARAEARRFQEEAARDVEAHWPDVIVWVNNPLSFLAGPTTDPYILDKGHAWLASGRYQFEGAVLSEPGQPAHYFLDPEAAAKFNSSQIQQAAYVIYRLKGNHGQ